MNDKVLKLKDWLGLLGGELDYDYGTAEQVNGRLGVFFLFFFLAVVWWRAWGRRRGKVVGEGGAEQGG